MVFAPSASGETVDSISSSRIQQLNIAAGSKEPNKNKVGKVTRKQVMDIVKLKGKDLPSRNDEASFKIIAATARQRGLEIVD